MSRLTNQQYLKRHHLLRDIWLHHPAFFSILEPGEQWQLHSYYQPSKDWTDAELHAHRVAITAQEPSLPARTGKLYRRLVHVRSSTPSHPNSSRVRVSAIAHPTIDARRFANAVVELMKEMDEAA